eukprot:m.148168 g.148168  ORF g.148168 m.148168 type:complete len:477 (-) comp17796_c0_seq1:63-1493(-)
MAMTTAEPPGDRKPKATIWKTLSSSRLLNATTKRAISAWEILKANESNVGDACDSSDGEDVDTNTGSEQTERTFNDQNSTPVNAADSTKDQQIHPFFSRQSSRRSYRPTKRRRRNRLNDTAALRQAQCIQRSSSTSSAHSGSASDTGEDGVPEAKLISYNLDKNSTPPPQTFTQPKNVRPKKMHQTYLDIGHRGFCHKTCGLCGMIYSPGEPSDEEMHKKYHDEVDNGVRLSSALITKHEIEHPLVCCEGDRIAWFNTNETGGAVRSKRIQSVLGIMDMDLGYVGSVLSAHSEIVYVYTRSGRVIGCVTVMRIDRGYKVVSEPPSASESRSVTPAFASVTDKVADTQSCRSHTGTRSAEDSGLDESVESIRSDSHDRVAKDNLISPAPAVRTRQRKSNVLWRSDVSEEASCGINRMWVHRKYRRSGIATVMLDTIRNTFLPDKCIPTSMLAFSQPTPAGQQFAETYTGRRDFLVFG